MGINSSNPAHDPAIVLPQTTDNRPVLDQKPITDKVGGGSTAHANAVHETFTCKDAPVENQRPLKVRVIGAGYSGVYLGIRIPQRLRNIDLKIYEKNEGVGGTWWENRYPGCACDIPCKQENLLQDHSLLIFLPIAHSYQYTFAPNKAWSGFYAPSHEICAYIDDVAEKYGAKRFIHLGHRVTSATWNDTAKKWYCLHCLILTKR
jgi:hypothetical protein